jgi:hypothetical protein
MFLGTGRLNWWADTGTCQRLWPLATTGNCSLFPVLRSCIVLMRLRIRIWEGKTMRLRLWLLSLGFYSANSNICCTFWCVPPRFHQEKWWCSFRLRRTNFFILFYYKCFQICGLFCWFASSTKLLGLHTVILSKI